MRVQKPSFLVFLVEGWKNTKQPNIWGKLRSFASWRKCLIRIYNLRMFLPRLFPAITSIWDSKCRFKCSKMLPSTPHATIHGTWLTPIIMASILLPSSPPHHSLGFLGQEEYCLMWSQMVVHLNTVVRMEWCILCFLLASPCSITYSLWGTAALIFFRHHCSERNN